MQPQLRGCQVPTEIKNNPITRYLRVQKEKTFQLKLCRKFRWADGNHQSRDPRPPHLQTKKNPRGKFISESREFAWEQEHEVILATNEVPPRAASQRH